MAQALCSVECGWCCLLQTFVRAAPTNTAGDPAGREGQFQEPGEMRPGEMAALIVQEELGQGRISRTLAFFLQYLVLLSDCQCRQIYVGTLVSCTFLSAGCCSKCS